MPSKLAHISLFHFLTILPVLLSPILRMNAFETVSSAYNAAAAEEPPASVQPDVENGAVSQPAVLLQAESGRRISFKTQNGRTTDQGEPSSLELPHLVLLRNASLTLEDERTLQVTVSGVLVPPPGVTATLTLQTQHGDPDQGGGDAKRLLVVHQSRWVPNSGSHPTVLDVHFRVVFTEHMQVANDFETTPSDYYRYELALIAPGNPAGSPLYHFEADHAFLLENQWIAALPAIHGNEVSAPRNLAIYFMDMTPFQVDLFRAETRLRREEVPAYVSGELLPAMQEAFRLQSETWGFSWYSNWHSYRSGEDASRLSVALTDGLTWYHGQAPAIGHAGISLKVSASYGENAAYSNLTEKLMSAFHHELFHNLQRSLSLEYGGQGLVSGKENAWAFFGEGMAVAASAAAQPQMQFSRAAGSRDYLASAGDFIQDLERSYASVNPYHAALYWRFLYEKCGGMQAGEENPRAGMAILRRTLDVLYSREIVDIEASTDLVRNLTPVMDRALRGSACPFQTHAQSLQGFAQSLYALHLDDGRCQAPGLPAGCGLYDPEAGYRAPAVAAGSLGSQMSLKGNIANSYGIDFIELRLDDSAPGKMVWAELKIDPTSQVRLGVDALMVDSPSGNPGEHHVSDCSWSSLTRAASQAGSTLIGVSPTTTGCERLVLIITRLDAEESLEPKGEYTVEMLPGSATSIVDRLGL